MLDYTSKPYQFHKAKPNRAIYHLGIQMNRMLNLKGKNHQIASLDLEGEKTVRELRKDKNVRLIFVANHSTHSDVEILTEAQRRVGIWGAFMAAHDVFVRGKLQSWIIQRMGAFSVNRDNVDVHSIKVASNIVKEGKQCLSIFPEGNVAFTNERVMPFLDGAAFVAIKSARSLKKTGEQVYIVPTSIRVTHKVNVAEQLEASLDEIAHSLGVELMPDADIVSNIEWVGYHLMKRTLAEHEVVVEDYQTWLSDPKKSIEKVAGVIAGKLEDLLEIKADGDVYQRARMIRSKIGKSGVMEDSKPHDLSMMLLRLLNYPCDYLREKPSMDRISETIEKLSEDSSNEMARAFSPKHAHVKFGAPILVSDQSPAELSAELMLNVQGGLDDYQSSYVGGEVLL